jgi:glyoxylase-like metal-dependent hydrolase (beta-lactamase superfamily II)
LLDTRTDLADSSQKDLENSLKKLSKILKPGMKVYPGHGEIFEIK